MTSQTATAASVAAAKPSPLSVLTQPRVYVALILLSLLLVVPALSDSPFVVHVFVTICVFAGLSTAWNIVAGSRKVVYIAWNEPIRLVTAAETITALSLTCVGLMPAAEAASSRSRTAVR